MADEVGVLVVNDHETSLVRIADATDADRPETLDAIAWFANREQASWFVEHLAKTGGMRGWQQRCEQLSLT